MDERVFSQYHIDFRTGKQSGIHRAGACGEQRSACLALNRIRARGILEADQIFAPGQPFSADVWEAAFARRAEEWQLPLISLEQLGISHDADGFRIASPDLVPLKPGAEASPYWDKANEVVYKLFDLRIDGSLGKKLSLELNDEGEFELHNRPARLRDTVEKLVFLNEIGAHPTEIVGLSYDGDYLVVKQPLAQENADFLKDRSSAIASIKAVIPVASGLRTTVCIAWQNRQTWLIGDLHERNIMRDGDAVPTIIDALIGPVPPLALRRLRWLRNAAEDAEALRQNLPLPDRKLFDDVDDREL